MEWLIYLLKVSVCTGLFYAFYYFFLRNLTFFKLNRAYLILTLVLSFFIPKLGIEIPGDSRPQVLQIVNSSMSQSVEPSKGFDKRQIQVVNTSPVRNVDWPKAISQVYWLVVIIMFVWFLLKVIKILLHTRKVDQINGSLKIIYKSNGFTNCSFFNYVFIDTGNLNQEEIDSLLKHESIHALRFHSLDKLLIVLCKSLLWFNPFIYFFGSALEQSHEYDADSLTAVRIGETSYAELLLAIATRKDTFNVMHCFASHPIKKRIKMLFTKKSQVMKKYIYLFGLPIVFGLVWLFGTQVVYASKFQNAPEAAVISEEKSIAETPMAYDINELDRLSAYAGKILETVNPLKKVVLVDTLRLVGSGQPKNVKVIIDGKEYPSSILTEIGPRCIESSNGGKDGINIKTKNNKILYALEFEKQNARVAQAAEKSKKVYIRYVQESEDGSRYCIAMLNDGHGGRAGVSVSLKGKVLVMIHGKRYTEKELRKLDFDSEVVKNIKTISAKSGSYIDTLYPEYSKKYESLLEGSASDML